MGSLIGLMGLQAVAALVLGTLLERRLRLGRFGRVSRQEVGGWQDEEPAIGLRHRQAGIHSEAQASH